MPFHLPWITRRVIHITTTPAATDASFAPEKIKTKDRELDQIRSELQNRRLTLEEQKSEFDKLNQRWKESENEIQRRQDQITKLTEDIKSIQSIQKKIYLKK